MPIVGQIQLTLSDELITMKTTLPLTAVLLGGVCFAVGIENRPNTATTNQSAVGESEKTQDEKAIQAATASFVKAYNAGDAKAIAALFTDDAESIDEDGTQVQGRQAIGNSFAETFAASPGSKMELKIDSRRFLSPDVVKEEGRCTITPARAGGPDVDRYTVLYVKKDGKWLQSSVREHPDQDRSPHERLKELEWLVGEWVDESDAAVVFTTCRWSEDKNFLLRHYTFQIQGRPAMTGTQRIGWDPVTGQFKSWVFDSQGGQSEGLWSRDGDRWVIKMSGPLRSGKISTETNIITRVNNDMARWKSVDRTAAGQVLPDSPEFVLVRKPPLPQ
jgi:uncharacterized protein (TIGR02246 family)